MNKTKDGIHYAKPTENEALNAEILADWQRWKRNEERQRKALSVNGDGAYINPQGVTLEYRPIQPFDTPKINRKFEKSGAVAWLKRQVDEVCLIGRAELQVS